MKNTNNIFIFISVLLSFLVIGCEQQADLPKSSPNDQIKIVPRVIEECDECPTGDCCCGVWLQNPQGYALLYFCGTSDGNELCSGDETGDCDAFTGGGQEIELTSQVPKRGFCVDPGQAFWVRNIGSSTAYIYITCQDDITGPQTLTITLTPSQILYIGSNGECEIVEC